MTTEILALDVATTTGWARGSIGSVPTSGSVYFPKYKESSEDAIFATCWDWISDQLTIMPRPDRIAIEALLPSTAKIGNTTTSVRDRLVGLQTNIRTVCFKRGFFDVQFYSVNDIREHFIGDRKMKREQAKRRTFQICHALNWPVETEDAADACALWSYACSLIDPNQALKLSPLFNKAIREVV